jgi:MFS transporter, AAHS family, benzoate transport protein
MKNENEGSDHQKINKSISYDTIQDTKNVEKNKYPLDPISDEEKNLVKKTAEGNPISEGNNDAVIDSILDSRGYTLYTCRVILLIVLILAVEGLHMNIFSSLLIPLTSYFNMSQSQIQLVSGILFIGVGLGSFASGTTAINYGRPMMINGFLLIIFIFNIIIGLTRNYIFFALCRFTIGFGVGLVVPIALNILAEYLPLKNRSLVLTGVWAGWSLGSLLLSCTMLIIMPNLEVSKVGYTIVVSSFLTLLTLILTFFLLKDSPRNLILMNKEKEAVEQIEILANRKLRDEEIQRMINEVRSGNSEVGSSILDIFGKKFLYLTILLTCIWFINSIITYGPYLVYTLTMKALNQQSDESHRQIIINQIVVNSINLPASLFGGILSEISFLGRNKATSLTLFLSFISGIFLITVPSKFAVFFGILQAFIGIAFNTNTTYSCEVYPTKIRDHALGFLFFCTRIGGFSSQVLYVLFNTMGVWHPYYFTGGFIALNIVLVIMLPYETFGQPLDFDFESTKSKKEEKSVTIETKTL